MPIGPSLTIPVAHGYLEAHIRVPHEPLIGAAVVCHPHPLHGGTMHTKAVYRAAQAMSEAGLVALRFNFRSVGRSTGSHDNGIGEKEDVRAAIDFLAEEFPDLPLVVGGFSFGSMVGLSAASDDARVVAMVGLGLAIAHNDFTFLKDADRPVLVVQGAVDEFGPGAEVLDYLRPLGDHIEVVVIPGADHFFHGHFDELRAAVRSFLTDAAGSKALASARGAAQ